MVGDETAGGEGQTSHWPIRPCRDDSQFSSVCNCIFGTGVLEEADLGKCKPEC